MKKTVDKMYENYENQWTVYFAFECLVLLINKTNVLSD